MCEPSENQSVKPNHRSSYLQLYRHLTQGFFHRQLFCKKKKNSNKTSNYFCSCLLFLQINNRISLRKWRIVNQTHNTTTTTTKTCKYSIKTHPGLEARAAAEGLRPAARCSRSAGPGEPPAGGDRVSGATCELSAGSSHWQHKSCPAVGETCRVNEAHPLPLPLPLSLSLSLSIQFQFKELYWHGKRTLPCIAKASGK